MHHQQFCISMYTKVCIGELPVPSLCALHQHLVYLGGDLDPVGQNLAEAARAEHVPQRGGRQRLGRGTVVVNIHHRLDT